MGGLGGQALFPADSDFAQYAEVFLQESLRDSTFCGLSTATVFPTIRAAVCVSDTAAEMQQ
jgi:hypothetical protein